MLIEVTTSDCNSTSKEPLLLANGLRLFIKKDKSFGRICQAPGYFGFFTQEPAYELSAKTPGETVQPMVERDLFKLQNEVTGVIVDGRTVDPSFIAFSAKISRSRLYFLIKDKSLYLSYDLRDLLPYSTRKLSPEVAYGIVKFGEAPEYHTVIGDIYCIPGGRYLKCNLDKIRDYISIGVIPEADFLTYFQVHYPGMGGDISVTELRLKEALQFISTKNPSLLISGGVDSSLLNFLYSEIAAKPYPAIFLHFNEAPEELAYAKQSIQGTKAEFIPVTISGEDIHDDFLKSIRRLIYPVYDNGSAFPGYWLNEHFLSKRGKEEHILIDGTLADSCYGVRNYNQPLKMGAFQPEFVSYFKEWVYSKILIQGIRYNRTKPRDSFLKDEFLQDLLWYGGPFVNTMFSNAKKYTERLKRQYYTYTDHLHPDNQKEYWPVYTILKLMLYAGKQTTVKTYDMLLPHQVYYPFMFRTILEDQGSYKWQEKSEQDTVKAPLKKILEKYIDKSFIYRKKTGLQSQTKRWLLDQKVKPLVLALLTKKNGIAEYMMGADAVRFARLLDQQSPANDIVSLALSMSVMQYWCDHYKIDLPA